MKRGVTPAKKAKVLKFLEQGKTVARVAAITAMSASTVKRIRSGNILDACPVKPKRDYSEPTRKEDNKAFESRVAELAKVFSDKLPPESEDKPILTGPVFRAQNKTPLRFYTCAGCGHHCQTEDKVRNVCEVCIRAGCPAMEFGAKLHLKQNSQVGGSISTW
jgi:hypothetical protein